MKKLLTVILAIVYMSTSIGATFHMHYCMGELADWGWGHNTSKTCNSCGMTKSDEKYAGCCEDKYQFLKSDTDQRNSEKIFHPAQSIAVASPVSFVSIGLVIFPAVKVINPVGDGPPRSSPIAVYILNRNFLI
jgi:hypothetical protein